MMNRMSEEEMDKILEIAKKDGPKTDEELGLTDLIDSVPDPSMRYIEEGFRLNPKVIIFGFILGFVVGLLSIKLF